MKTLTAKLSFPVTIAFFVSATSAFAQTPTVKEESPGLLKKAKITTEAARTTALARVPNSTVNAAEIEQEKGKLVYIFDLKVRGKTGIEEVAIDAITGAVVSVEHETPEDEAKEAKDEKEKAAKAKPAQAVKKPG